MNYFKVLLIVFFSTFLVSSCKQHQEARKPISHSSGSFMKQSIARNKKMIAKEEDQIEAVIKSDPKKQYIASKKGYWYYYETRNLTDSLNPKKGDIAFFDYEIKDLSGNIIYSQEELEPQTYKVDKQEIMMGLRDGIKLMRKKEKVHFLFTSHMGYGYHGDNNKIGTNQPLFCTVTLNDFMPESEYNKQMQPATIAKATVTPAIKSKAIIKDTLTN
ncbi:gliding motility-associated peptidyl-prolyl isomerase GldI [Flavobacterium sp. 5]|uniref:gliding motility-associated peptidyl-prolyl isomerase GldI n=1 Tax=Flavobacterium sp. 5 TaxID=2035199 RepID=UPI000C2BEC32|nr:gliding motility-associated peptidyl-prolyl isomerase GldI [Flavobacterium sp. 5]PKB15623.1 protein involved in gliding motility GldI [Flavobacterium sp. 5]